MFSTKERKNLIPEDELQDLRPYLGGIARNTNVVLIIAGGMRDHVHLLFELPAKADVADAVMTFKSNSSRWMRERHRDFAWPAGYGAFSVRPSQISAVNKYISNQAEHHTKRDFKEDFLIMLRKAGVD